MEKYYKIILTFFFFIIFLCLFFFTHAQTTFEKKYASSYDQSGRDVLPTPDGGYIIAGMTETQFAGDSDIYAIKTNSIGDMVWTKSYGGYQPENAYCILATADSNYFILGYTKSYGAGNYDIWLLKINPSGDTLWTKTYGTSGEDEGKGIIATDDGNYVIVGRTYNSANASSDACLIKINPAGTILWTKYYGGPQYDTGHSVRLCSDGGYILVGQTFSYGTVAGDIYLVKTNSAGDSLWTKTFGGIYEDEADDITINSDNSFTICGKSISYSAGSEDVWVIKTNAVGIESWNKTYGGTDKDVAHTIQQTPDGGYILGCISRSFGWINPDMWLVKINAVGDTLWTRNFGSWYHDHCHGVRTTSDGGYIAIGHSEDVSLTKHVYFLKLDALGIVPVEEIALEDVLNVYPNPAEGHLNLNYSLFAKGVNIEIYNILGTKIYSQQQTSNVRSQTVIDVSGFDRGLYFLKLSDEKNSSHSFVKKIILN